MSRNPIKEWVDYARVMNHVVLQYRKEFRDMDVYDARKDRDYAMNKAREAKQGKQS